MHVRRKLAAAGVAVAAAPLLAVIAPATPASAHGTMSDPPSRVYQCKNEGPENPKSEGCKAAVREGGAAPFYDWNEVSLLDAGGDRSKVPNGQLCSAGRSKYRGLDEPVEGWPAKSVRPGPLTVTYHASAPHASSQFTFFVTRDGYKVTNRLNWSDLEEIENFDRQNPSTFTKWTINLPPRTGRHILYTVWQRSVGSAEAFYSCSDIDFGGGSNNPPPVTNPPTNPPTTQPTTPPTTRPTTAPPTTAPTTQPPATGGGTWAAGVAYSVGPRVTYNGQAYTVRQSHTSLTGWEPPHVPALWLPA